MTKSELWLAIIVASSLLTFGVVGASTVRSKGRDKIDLSQIAWMFVGFVCAIAIFAGLIDALMNGYGDGDIF